jgi:glycosyltransferase involved in cell wall biosynthesis
MQINGLLTIGIPTYNGGENLPALLASIKNLRLNDLPFEILIVDNNSTDDTDNVISQLKTVYLNIRYYKNGTNIGRIENWNKVLDLAQGEFLILMNVNDRFFNYDSPKYLSLLKKHPEVALVMNDVLFENYQYPNWTENGIIDLNAYIEKTFLGTGYLEFNSLGVLQQHIFRTQIIKDHKIEFDPQIPRTTDRVFIAQTIKNGGEKFFYSACPIVNWHLNENRYHNQIHNSLTHLDELWGNEYKANIEVARIAEVSYVNILKSQMLLASFMRFANGLRNLKRRVFKITSADKGVEISTAYHYYNHLKAMARLNHISPNYLLINILAFKRAATWFLRSLNVFEKKPRTIKDITMQDFTSP